MESRKTIQKSLILKCLQNHAKSHVTADEIINILKEQKTPVGKATVYRYLSILEESGALKKYTIAEGQSSCYQYIGDNEECKEHYHLICQCCGSIVHFEDSLLQKMFGDIKDTKGFIID